MSLLKCDFCSDLASWAYPASDFIVSIIPSAWGLNASKGNWAACGICHDLIEAKMYTDLRERSLTRLFVVHPEIPTSARGRIRKYLDGLHKQFHQSRTGAGYRMVN